MEYEKKYFGNGQGNFDDADFALQPNQWVNMQNLRIGSTDKGVVGTVESIAGTVLVSSPEPSVTFVTIGSIEDEENNRIIFFNKNLHGPWDKIVCYDIATETFYNVLLSSQVDGFLNFNKDTLIHSARIVNNMLYWVEGTTNQPRKINIDAGIKLNHPGYPTNVTAYVAPIDWREITLVKPPPPLAPNIEKQTDGSFDNNFIANESFSFAFQYVFYDNEVSVVGTYSPASRLNQVNDTYNMIEVTMDSAERVPQTVRIVNLVVRIGNNAFVIKTWDKDIAAEAAQIQDQNDNINSLTYDFFNNITGQALSQDEVLKPFDSVPIYSGTLEVAKNRLFLGNNTEGYDAPTTSSLNFNLTEIDIAGGSVSKNLISFQIRYLFPTSRAYSGWYVYLTEVVPAGYYSLDSTEQTCMPCIVPPTLPPPPTTIAFSDLTFRGATTDDVVAYVKALVGGTGGDTVTITTTANMCEITGLGVDTYNVFKSFSQYNIGIVFYDFAMRKCSVVLSSNNLVSIPQREFELSTGIGSINWTLSNTNAINQIPSWAYYYTIVRTLNLRTRFFLQAVEEDAEAKYATKDDEGVYVFTDDTFVTGAVGIGINTTSLVQAGLGYVFTEGDVMRLIKEDNTDYTLSVIGQSGKYIIVNVPEGGIGDLSTFKILYEVYTPYQTSEQEPYYEMGNMYRVVDPTTNARRYETLAGSLLPDAYALTRNYGTITYFAETMSPNDRFFSRWDTDAGKVNLIVKQGQRVKESSISFSNVFLPGTATNGLSTFEALNEKPVPAECGPLQKLILTSKVQDQGDVMLAICTKETNSVYLGETQILDSTGTTQFFAASSGVIGSINTLKGSFGTLNPESVVEFRGNVYWVDILNGKVVQYSLNGLFPISNYKMTRFWSLFCQQYLSMSQVQIEALGSRPFIFCTVDPHHWELLISVPRVLSTPPSGTLPDYTNIVYPFDIWDGQAKTIVYKLNIEPNFWQGSYSFTAENFVTVQNQLYSFKRGLLWLHNQTTYYGDLHGSLVDARIMFISNQVPSRPKVYRNMSVEVNRLPNLTYFLSQYPYQQVSNLQDFDWESKEGILYSQIYRNVLTPSATGLVPNALVVGEVMRTAALRVMLSWPAAATPVELRFVNIGYVISLGHKT